MTVNHDMRADGQYRLDGLVAVVTGASRGIGRAIAEAFASRGATVVLAARTRRDVDEAASALLRAGYEAASCQADVADWAAVQQLASFTIEKFGPADILVNNAGVQGQIGPLIEADVAAWIETVRTNLLGTVHCCKAFAPAMITRRQGRIINLSGGGATLPRANFSAYAASKAAVVRLTETLAEELRPFNVKVNAIAPGPVNTRMLDEVIAAGAAAGSAAQEAALAQRREGGVPSEWAAALAVYLASSASDGLTGKLISACHDDWHSWTPAEIDVLASQPWFTLRRLDRHTLERLSDKPRFEARH